MSGFLYKSYCYETVEQVAASVHSAFDLPFGVIQSVAPSGSSLTITYLDVNANPAAFSYTLATCEKLGFDNSFSGLTKDDSVLIASSMVSVLIAAWVAKIVRRAL